MYQTHVLWKFCVKKQFDGILSKNICLKFFASKYSLKENEQHYFVSIDVAWVILLFPSPWV